MKAAIAQINPTIGDFALNARKMTDAIAAAKRAGAALVVFPELTTTGYPPRDLLDYEEFADANLKCLDTVAKAATGITAICGFVEKNPAPTGKPYFNAAAVLQEGRVIAVYRKQLLPYYDVFDEERYFEPGPVFGKPLFTLDGKRVAVTICEDAWNCENCLKRPYAVRPIEALRASGADLVVNLSASPFQLGKPALRIKLFTEAAAAVGAPVLFCNQAGGNDEILFDGCSFAVTPEGKLLAAARAFGEELLIVDLESKAAVQPPWPKEEAEWLFDALVMGLRDYAAKCGAHKVCLGLSGGVDSSVVAAIAVAALGKENVAALSLPTRYTASASREDAETLATRLGIELKLMPIEPLFTLVQDQWKTVFGHAPAGVALENIQPRLRMTLLMALANEQDRLLLNTSNKSEIACGYATLYGDSAGALAVLGDLTKGQVYALARHVNRAGEIIPARVLTRPPTAELRDNQTDQDTLPPYDVLDKQVNDAIVGLDLRGANVQSAFGRLFAVSEYKRYQLPPVLRISSRAFGVGRRIPIASRKPWQP